MSESFEQLFNEESIKTIRSGEVVHGKVIAVKDNEIVLNVGAKSDGIIQKNEFTNDQNAVLADLVKVGDELDAKVLRANDGEGQIQLSVKRLRIERVSEILQNAFDNNEVLTATVDEVVRGGLTCTLDETKIFIPASLVSDVFDKDLSKYLNTEIQFVLTEYNPRRHRVIGDRKQLLVAEKEKALADLLAKLQVGDVIEGMVKNTTDFGAFIDIGGADGLLHISEMSWGRIENPKKVFKSGDKVKVFVKAIEGNKIALSKKFEDENPWANAEERFAIGNVIEGIVARMTDFGAFIELAKGVDGLLHVSQIAHERVEKPADALKKGDTIKVKVTGLDLDGKKISLSLKALAPKPEKEVAEETEDTADEVDVDVEAYAKKLEEEALEGEVPTVDADVEVDEEALDKANEVAKDATEELADSAE